MKINERDRLFEVFEKVNKIKLNESTLSEEERDNIVTEFVNYATERINLSKKPNVELSYDENLAKEMKSYGCYSPTNNQITIVASKRNLGDILRTLAHELIHLKQDENGKIKPDSGETGSQIENEANSMAGILMREFGKINPIIFE